MSDSDPPGRSRRSVLAAALGSLVALAGCSGGDGAGGTDAATETATPTGESTTAEAATGTATGTVTPTATTPGTTTGDLDLREANVTAVEFERSGGGYRFSVTLYHDDDGEAGYANWWQVETTGGERLGRRELLHAHGTREFTRSSTVEVPGDVTTVVVRGHDETHGYGGQAAVVDLETGRVELVRQGSDPRALGG